MRILAVVKKKHHSTLAEIFKELSQPQLRLLGYACRNADLVKKSGFELGEEVVFSLGQDYLERSLNTLAVYTTAWVSFFSEIVIVRRGKQTRRIRCILNPKLLCLYKFKN
jgi:hypothetical protein